ncbi:fasciculation and elongation protein zeta-1 isoform X2 [Leucoraja erinacea]|uniref:fasciculation and elongation protein zeta-1 isoform X2 n=1 Tax=Leucoraja erinaceus TaxID=7782 RepID=UPI002455D3B4|nr:fasciculation and elongation protein zeta-1 isoform X2 [Leucoraja erinacea]
MAAPLVTLDEEWQDFYELKPERAGGRGRQKQPMEEENLNELGSVRTAGISHLEELSELDNFTTEMMSFKSMEDLVNDFDEKLNVCFRNYNEKTENLAPVIKQAAIEEEEFIRDDEIWDALTDNYITSTAEDWRTARLQELNMNLSNMEASDKDSITEDGELIEKLDVIASSTSEEPLFTAEQVIEEIEEMMQNSPDPDVEETPSQSDKLSVVSLEVQVLKPSICSNNNILTEDVKLMTEAEVGELLVRIELAIKDYSEELIQQLALRDELEFEKEVKNSFISILIEVQNKQKEHRESMKKKKKDKGGVQPSVRQERVTRMPVKYLTTVIPYEKKGTPPTVEDLQILTTILLAMKEDSEKVPVLLTDYILKVLCPT